MLTQKELLKIFTYNELTGKLYWNYRVEFSKTWNTRYANKEAGTVNDSGHIIVTVNYKRYRAHLIIWCIIYGIWPDHIVDHKDNNGSNNKKTNLRKATRTQNNTNQVKRCTNTSGYKGVVLLPSGKYRAVITYDKKVKHLGCFTTAEEAHEAYVIAAHQHHGEFAKTQ